MSKITLVKTILLKAPPEHVWKFLTEKDKLALWFYEGEQDVRAGGEFVLMTNSLGKEGERQIWGDVIEFDPPRKLVHSFTHEWLKGVTTICTWTLTGVEGGTILKLEHEGFEKVQDGAFDLTVDHDKGWDEGFIRLRRVTA